MDEKLDNSIMMRYDLPLCEQLNFKHQIKVVIKLLVRDVKRDNLVSYCRVTQGCRKRWVSKQGIDTLLVFCQADEALVETMRLRLCVWRHRLHQDF